EVVKALTSADKGSDSRQVGVVDARGDVAPFTGKECNDWAGGKTGKSYACQGNLLKGKEVVEAMARAFEGETRPPPAGRLRLALGAGGGAGGARRGKQSAALLVVRAGAGPNGLGDRYLDSRVDDHDRPVQELARLLAKRLPRPPKR